MKGLLGSKSNHIVVLWKVRLTPAASLNYVNRGYLYPQISSKSYEFVKRVANGTIITYTVSLQMVDQLFGLTLR